MDGGADFAPNGTLFVTTYPTNQILQYLPGSTEPDRTTSLSTIGIPGSVGGLRFVPPGFPGAGELKVTSYDEDAWFTVPYSEAGDGTYSLGDVIFEVQLQDTGPESPVYVFRGHKFPQLSVLIAEYDTGTISAYQMDSFRDPMPQTARVFIQGDRFSPAAMVRDPVTYDVIIGATTPGRSTSYRVSRSTPQRAT